MSMNEELQSTNEELETSKEELQSLNEELNTVNNQLQDKVAELEAANNDLANLLNCTDVATVFLDSEFRIRRFTPEAAQLFNLIATDVGRPIGDITRKFSDAELLNDAANVLQQLSPREKEVRTDDGRSWFRRVVPYRTLDQRIEGVVLTFGEVTQIKAADMRALQERESRISAILNTAADAIITIDQGGTINSINPMTERMFGYTREELVGKNVKVLMPPPYAEEHDQYIANYLRTGVKQIIGIGREVLARHKDGTLIPVDLSVSEVDHMRMFTGILHDISERKQLEHEIVEIALLEQQRLGADLHDTCGQELTALGLLVDSLVQSLKQERADVELAKKIAEGLKRTHQSIRDVAQGLLRAEVDPTQLNIALKELIARLDGTSGLRCTFEADSAIAIKDSITATHLYHITQEACTNALRHAEGKEVHVRLDSDGGVVRLCIQDDGIGIPDDATEGLGMRIMRNRARVIGAKLLIESKKPGGTVVTCILPEGQQRAARKH
jgi:PAS domain S-box-containing protein